MLVHAVLVCVMLTVALCLGLIDDIDNLLGLLHVEDELPFVRIFVET